MPPGDTDVTMKQDRTSITPGEQVLSPLALAQSYLGIDAFRSAAGDPRIRMATVESSIQQRTKELQDAQKDLNFYQTHWDLYKGQWTGGMDVTKQALNLAKQKVGSLQESIANMEAEKSILPDQVKEFQQTQDMSNLVGGRLKSFLSGEDLGVSPEERRLISEGISGISQDVATSRGLNRTDVPVMQAVAPAVSQALLAQANANRSLLTGMNQFSQGMGLSNRQLQMGLAGQNPAASLTGVYAGLAPGGQNQSSSRGLGGADVMSMFGQGAMGAGLGLYGLGAAGLLGGGAAVTGGGATGATLGAYGGSMAMGSDRRRKDQLGALTKALQKIRHLTGYQFVWKDTHAPGHGVVAQDVQAVLPTAVTEEHGSLVVDYAAIIALLVEAVKELDVQVQHG